MISYNNQGILLLEYIMHLYRYMTENMRYTKPPEVDRVWHSLPRLRIAARVNFGPPGIFK